jgi:hypothetical protein
MKRWTLYSEFIKFVKFIKFIKFIKFVKFIKFIKLKVKIFVILNEVKNPVEKIADGLHLTSLRNPAPHQTIVS